MPFVRVSILEGKDEQYKSKIADTIYEALRRTFNVPENDKFIVIHEHKNGELHFPSSYLGMHKDENVVFVQIFANNTRTLEQKKELYKSITFGLGNAIALHPENILINLVEVPKENWSFGNGIAQYG